MGTPVESSVAATSVAEPAAKTAHIGAARNLSQSVADLIYDHCVAYAELGRISHQTDAIVLGRQPTSGEWRRLEESCDHERALLIKLCAAPAGTDAERYGQPGPRQDGLPATTTASDTVASARHRASAPSPRPDGHHRKKPSSTIRSFASSVNRRRRPMRQSRGGSLS